MTVLSVLDEFQVEQRAVGLDLIIIKTSVASYTKKCSYISYYNKKKCLEQLQTQQPRPLTRSNCLIPEMNISGRNLSKVV